VTTPPPVPPQPRPPAAGSPWDTWRLAFGVMAVTVGLLWLVEAVNLATDNRLDEYGIVPRSADGLWGVAFAPFLHASVSHLVGNSIPLVALGWIGLVGNQGRFLAATAIVWVTSGLGAWLVGPSGAVVIGASGVVYGWIGYLIVRGWVARDVGQALVGAAVLVVYGGGAIWGALPLVSGHVAWQAHLFGLVGGVLGAYLLDARRPERPAPLRLPSPPPTVP
jgi:membrane associated rhomboid family serine protease